MVRWVRWGVLHHPDAQQTVGVFVLCGSGCGSDLVTLMQVLQTSRPGQWVPSLPHSQLAELGPGELALVGTASCCGEFFPNSRCVSSQEGWVFHGVVSLLHSRMFK